MIINRGAIDKGLFHLTYYKTHVEEEEVNEFTGTRIVFGNPAELTANGTFVEDFGKRFGNYTKLDASGMPKENEKISEGDVYLGKCLINVEMEEDEEDDSIFKAKKKTEVYKDKSVIADKNMSGIVDKVYVFGEPDGHQTSKIRFRKTRTPVLGDKCGCYSDDTEILTNSGWKVFSQLEKTDKVASLVGDSLIYQHPTEIQTYDYKGDLYKLSSNQVELLVTGNHRMYVRARDSEYRIEKAEDLYRKIRYYKKDVDVWTPDLTNPPEEFVMEDGKVVAFKIKAFTDKFGKEHKGLHLAIKPWLVMLGIWIAEGYAKDEDYMAFATHKPRVKKALIKCCEELGLEIRKHKTDIDGNTNAWIIIGKQVWNTVKPLSVGAINKYLPDWVWSLPRDLCDDLITGMILGDGDYGTVKKGRYYTASELLADDFQRLCLHAGYSTNKCLKSEAGSYAVKKDGYVITQNSDYYCLSIITKQNEPIVNKYMYAPDNNPNDSWQAYDGKVYCCTVPRGEGLLYVRRHGFGVWSGNSRMAQKGVIGMIMNHEDMPYTKDGIVPDIIINPHAIPTRMTIAHILESVLSKLACQEGRIYDGTPFCNQDIESAYDRLEKRGFQKHGDEVMYNGITGEQIPTDIFIGPTFYTRMKHMVEDKINGRSGGLEGNYIQLTRQPVKSRSKGGAGRVGEMEMGSILSHGIASFLKESMMERSDKYDYYVDEHGDIAVSNDKQGFARSQTDDNSTRFTHVETPFATKLFFQELECMSIIPRMMCDGVEDQSDGEMVDDDQDDQDEEDADGNKKYDETDDAIVDLMM